MEEVKPEPVQPNVVTFNTLMNKAGTFEEASSVIKTMEEVKPKPVQPDVVTFNTLMNKVGTFEEVKIAIDIWKSWGERANRVFGALTQSLARRMHAEKVLETCFGAARSQEIKFPTTSFQNAISEYIALGNSEGAFRIAVAFPHLPGALKAMKARPHEAEAFFKKHMEKEPNHSSYALARLFDVTDNADQCVAWCQKALVQNREMQSRVKDIRDMMERNQPNNLT